MIRLALPVALALALAACGDQAATANAEPVAAPAETTAAPTATSNPTAADRLDAAIAGDWRTGQARDNWRHPRETLQFFGIEPDMQVVEITPGGGWYSEILAPYLREEGRLAAAVVDPSAVDSEGAKNYYGKSNQALRDKFAASPAQYDKVTVVEYDPAAPRFGEPASADAVVTFRNVHNWMSNSGAAAMFAGFHDVLKPGGVLGVVEHRADQDVPAGDKSGYVSEAQVIALAEGAGFVLDEKSEINANPNDTKDHPNGVWTLPPGNRHDEADAGKYAAIGESDRMTLRFVKPAE